MRSRSAPWNRLTGCVRAPFTRAGGCLGIARRGRIWSVTRRRVVVHGYVQGVFFRDTLRRMAQQRGVSGWAANRADGTVEAIFEGDDAAVERLVEWAHHGPRDAPV